VIAPPPSVITARIGDVMNTSGASSCSATLRRTLYGRYVFAVGGPHFMVFLTPIGGVTLIVGWLLVIAAALVVKDE